jgi:hypothetical protein
MGARQQQASGGFDQQMAQDIIDQAIQNQTKARIKLRDWGRDYIDRTETAQSELDTLFGRSGAQAVQSWEKGFSEGIPGLQATYELKQQKAPGILNSSSFDLLKGTLGESASQFTGGMDTASGKTSAQLYQALAAPAAGFEAIANRPAFNKLYDPTYMELAKNPPTVRSDVDSMKSLYTYNV